MKKALIITDLSFPSGSAMASRILSFCHLFMDIGYDVHVIAGKGKYDSKYENDGFTYEIVKANYSQTIQSYIGNFNLIKRINDYLDDNNVDFVFSTSLNMNFNRIYRIIKKHNTKMILEQCEWYDSSSFRFGKSDPRFIAFENNIKNNYKKVDGIIAISSYLYNHFISLNCKVIKIPSIVNVENNKRIKDVNERIKLVYTGNPSKSKDLLQPIIEAYLSKEEYCKKIQLDIYGANEESVLRNINYNNELLDCAKNKITIHGMVTDEEFNNMLDISDFQIFIKPNRRSSKACFPTKLAESMINAIPVIANDTGDVCTYLRDEYNGLVCTGTAKEDVQYVFDRLIKLNNNEIKNMKRNAVETAKKSFDYRNYIELVKNFIETL